MYIHTYTHTLTLGVPAQLSAFSSQLPPSSDGAQPRTWPSTPARGGLSPGGASERPGSPPTKSVSLRPGTSERALRESAATQFASQLVQTPQALDESSEDGWLSQGYMRRSTLSLSRGSYLPLWTIKASCGLTPKEGHPGKVHRAREMEMPQPKTYSQARPPRTPRGSGSSSFLAAQAVVTP